MDEIKLMGEPLTAGIASGRVCLFKEDLAEALPKYSIPASAAGAEQKRLLEGIKSTAGELRGIREKVSRAIGETEAEIFTAHIMILDDSSFIDGILGLIASRNINAEWALLEGVAGYEKKLAGLPSDYFRERAGDLDDIAKRIVRNLGYRHAGFACGRCGQEAAVVAAKNLSPSLVHELTEKRAAGIIIENGSSTSHGAILAKALGIPAIIKIASLVEHLTCGAPVILDGRSGTVHINPGGKTVRQYRQLLHKKEKPALRTAGGRLKTRDRAEIRIMANASSAQEIARARRHGVRDVGLVRTEFLFTGRETAPPEGEQAEVYRGLARAAGGEVTFRLLDAGGDKDFPFLPLPPQENPNLGLKGARLYPKYPEIISEQISAVLESGTGKPVRIAVPMVAVIEEFLEVRSMILKIAAKKRIPRTGLLIGCMVEIPAAVCTLERFAEECDFFSVGTNDLIQYLMGADRGSGCLEELKNPLQPAVIMALKRIAEVSDACGAETSVCGEMAGEPETAGILAGLGYRSLSMNPGSMEKVIGMLKSSRLSELEAAAEKLLGTP